MYRTKKILPFFLTSVFLLFTVGCATIPSGKFTGQKKPYHERIVAVGDVHGNYEGLISILRKAALIDEKNQWIGGTALLVQTGDLLDRGTEVRKVMGLLMSLELQAERAGGKVAVLMGNHEAMNIVGDLHDVNPEVYKSFLTSESSVKQREAFERWHTFFGIASRKGEETPDAQREKWMKDHPPGFVEYTEALGPDGVYGKWLRTCPAVFQYGGTVFVHGGISKEYSELSLAEINQRMVKDIERYDKLRSLLMDRNITEQFFSMTEVLSVVDGIIKADETGDLSESLSDIVRRMKEDKSYFNNFYDSSPLMAKEGPLWFRGFSQWNEEKLASFLPAWLESRNVWRVVSAHTPSKDGKIKSRMENSIYLIDTGMLSSYYRGGSASALEIRDDEVTSLYESGDRVSFPPPVINYGPPLVWKYEDGDPLAFDTLEDIEKYLLTAELFSSEKITTGVNRPLKVSLEKDGHKINAIFRYQSKSSNPEYSKPEARYFLDSYRGEIAAYGVNRILGINNIPPTVYRNFKGKQGTLQLWAEGTRLDRERAQKNILPPESKPWNSQMWDMRVFDNLINNIDRNQTNILIDPNWRLILIDHTQSFARDHTLPKPEQVVRCSRGLWYALRNIDEEDVKDRLEPYLDKMEIDAFFARRQVLIRLIKDLIKQKGEENVLF